MKKLSEAQADALLARLIFGEDSPEYKGFLRAAGCCVRCGQPSGSEVCSRCTAEISQRTLEKIIALAEQALQTTGRMKRICCVCQAEFGTTPCLPEMDGHETHGLCSEECKRKMLEG